MSLTPNKLMMPLGKQCKRLRLEKLTSGPVRKTFKVPTGIIGRVNQSHVNSPLWTVAKNIVNLGHGRVGDNQCQDGREK